MLKSFRYFLLPLSIIYGIIIWIRNILFDKNILKSAEFNFPIICVGNLATGGTGKTPMTEYIVEHLKNKFTIATLSRGYKRRTRGFVIANTSTTALEIGDEPMQFHLKFPDITVAVGEERILAIPQILHQRPNTQVIVLDDAFQHRTVRAGLNILLTDYSNLYTRDLMFPAGDLRDIKASSKRADIIVITKCNPNFSEDEKIKLLHELNPLSHQNVFFTAIEYGIPYHLFKQDIRKIENKDEVLLVCGIANPKPIKDFLNHQVRFYEMIQYPDHHIFTIDDLLYIKKQFEKIHSNEKMILITEKDAVRINKFKSELADFPIYVLPVKHRFLFSQEDEFYQLLEKFINVYSNNKQ